MKKNFSNKTNFKERPLRLIILSVLGTLVALQVIGLLVEYSQLSRYKNYWNNQNETAQGELVYVSLGDSAAQGVGATRPQNSYAGQIAQRLEEKTGKTVKHINLSKSGALIEDVLDRQLKLAEQYSPDIITVEIGANDVKPRTEEQFRKDFTELVKRVPADIYIADIPDFVYGKFVEKQRRFAVIAREIIATREDVNFVPLDATTQANFVWYKHYAPDYFHPNSGGYGVWADAFWGVIEPKL